MVKPAQIMYNKERSGRTRKLIVKERRQVIKYALKNPTTNAKMLAANIKSISGKNITFYTVRNVLHNTGTKGKRPTIKAFISEVNRQKSLEFAKKYKSNTLDFYKNVIFSDESKFEIFDPKTFIHCLEGKKCYFVISKFTTGCKTWR